MKSLHPHNNDHVTLRSIECRTNIIQIMKRDGFYDSIMESGPNLDRMKSFLLAFDSQLHSRMQERSLDKSLPCPRLFPLFPGIHNQFFHDSKSIPASLALEQNFESIRQEALVSQSQSKGFTYSIRDMTKETWHIDFFSSKENKNNELFSKTIDILNSLPNRCQVYPWGDALFSTLEPGAHIPAHYSLDNLRVRCMLGVTVPTGCSMRVGTELTTWQEGRTLLFEDSFEHEVWHRGTSNRILLILDFWHPDLTAIEIETLTIALSHPDTRAELSSYLGSDSEKYDDYVKQTMHRKKVPTNSHQFWTNS